MSKPSEVKELEWYLDQPGSIMGEIPDEYLRSYELTSARTVGKKNKQDSEEKKSEKLAATTTNKKKKLLDTSLLLIEGLTEDQIRSPVINKILGCIYGQALGDAYGLSTEFETKADVTKAYGDKPVPFPDCFETPHNRRWDTGDWTDDTDQMILIMETIIEIGEPSAELFAFKLLDWIENGFPELGDYGGSGLGATVAAVCHHPKFLENPHLAARSRWLASGKQLAANGEHNGNNIIKYQSITRLTNCLSNIIIEYYTGSVMRTSILGCHNFKDEKAVIENTELLGMATHFDPRCRASCIAITLAISRILQGAPCSTKEEIDKLIEELVKSTLKAVPELVGPQKRQFVNYVNATAEDISKLKLDDPNKIGYCYKSFASGYYALRSLKGFKETMNDIVKEGGDADSNACVAGAIWGVKHGYTALPQEWLRAMPNKEWLDEKIIEFLKVEKLI
jgi:ADP-ribosylglycohydrolase